MQSFLMDQNEGGKSGRAMIQGGRGGQRVQGGGIMNAGIIAVVT